MNFDEIKDQIREALASIRERIEESSMYNTARERFEQLSTPAQKAIVVGAVITGVLLVLSFPLGMLLESTDFNTEFQSNRETLRELLQAQTVKDSITVPPPGLSSGEIKSRVSSVLESAFLLEEQRGSIDDLPPKASQLASPPIIQTGVSVALKKLNLSEIINIGHQLQTIDQSIVLTGLEINATQERDNYFNVVYQLVSFALPPIEEAQEGQQDRPRRSGGGK